MLERDARQIGGEVVVKTLGGREVYVDELDALIDNLLIVDKPAHAVKNLPSELRDISVAFGDSDKFVRRDISHVVVIQTGESFRTDNAVGSGGVDGLEEYFNAVLLKGFFECCLNVLFALQLTEDRFSDRVVAALVFVVASA